MKTSWTGSFEAPDNSILPYQDLVLELSFRMLFLCGSCYVISSEMINYVCYEYFDASSRLLSIELFCGEQIRLANLIQEEMMVIGV